MVAMAWDVSSPYWWVLCVNMSVDAGLLRGCSHVRESHHLRQKRATGINPLQFIKPLILIITRNCISYSNVMQGMHNLRENQQDTKTKRACLFSIFFFLCGGLTSSLTSGGFTGSKPSSVCVLKVLMSKHRHEGDAERVLLCLNILWIQQSGCAFLLVHTNNTARGSNSEPSVWQELFRWKHVKSITEKKYSMFDHQFF